MRSGPRLSKGRDGWGRLCADVLAPFWEECGDLISGVAPSTFAFDIPAFGVFAGARTHTRAPPRFWFGLVWFSGSV